MRRRRAKKIDELVEEKDKEAQAEAQQALVRDDGAEVPPHVGAQRRVDPPPRP